MTKRGAARLRLATSIRMLHFHSHHANVVIERFAESVILPMVSVPSTVKEKQRAVLGASEYTWPER
jgi:hypothetical protein